MNREEYEQQNDEEQERQPPKSMAELMRAKIEAFQAKAAEKRKGGINSERAQSVQEVMTLMQEFTLPNLLRNATKGEEARYEEIKGNKEKVRDWAVMVYNRRFKYWLGRTRHVKNPYDITLLIKKAREGKNPQALFNYLLKQHK